MIQNIEREHCCVKSGIAHITEFLFKINVKENNRVQLISGLPGNYSLI